MANTKISDLWDKAFKGMRKPEILVLPRSHGKTELLTKMLNEYQEFVKQDIAVGVGIPVKELFEEKDIENAYRRGDNNSRVLKHSPFNPLIQNFNGEEIFLGAKITLARSDIDSWQWNNEMMQDPIVREEEPPSQPHRTYYNLPGSNSVYYVSSDNNINKKYDEKYPHTCFKCKKKIFFEHAWVNSEEIQLEHFKKLWKSEVIEFYCCNCFRKQEKIFKKETRLIAKAKRISAKFGYNLR